jgi:mannose-6-phosphate isomerase-like protein (cupin superfamily)
MQTFDLASIITQAAGKNQAWFEFLRAPALSMGVYRLKSGQTDAQKPHTEDEVYYVVSGKASLRAGDETQAVASGSLLYVERGVAHSFCDITEDLTVLVFFGPPEGSLARTPTLE